MKTKMRGELERRGSILAMQTKKERKGVNGRECRMLFPRLRVAPSRPHLMRPSFDRLLFPNPGKAGCNQKELFWKEGAPALKIKEGKTRGIRSRLEGAAQCLAGLGDETTRTPARFKRQQRYAWAGALRHWRIAHTDHRRRR